MFFPFFFFFFWGPISSLARRCVPAAPPCPFPLSFLPTFLFPLSLVIIVPVSSHRITGFDRSPRAIDLSQVNIFSVTNKQGRGDLTPYQHGALSLLFPSAPPFPPPLRRVALRPPQMCGYDHYVLVKPDIAPYQRRADTRGEKRLEQSHRTSELRHRNLSSVSPLSDPPSLLALPKRAACTIHNH